MKARFVIFSNDVSDFERLDLINNTQIKFGKKKLVVSRQTLDVNYRAFFAMILEGRAVWKYRMYDLNNRRRDTWLIREKDYKKLIEGK